MSEDSVLGNRFPCGSSESFFNFRKSDIGDWMDLKERGLCDGLCIRPDLPCVSERQLGFSRDAAT
jgi:hypothetical protein